MIFSCGRADSVEKPIMKAPITVGAEQLSAYLPLIEGKNVGVVANQSSLIQQTHLVDALIENKVSIIRPLAGNLFTLSIRTIESSSNKYCIVL